MTNEQKTEITDGLTALALMTFTYFSALIKEGFLPEQALKITISWQTATIQKPSEQTPLQQFLERTS